MTQQTLSESQLRELWKATFSTSNPFCPCTIETFTKTARAVEAELRRLANFDRHRAAPAASGMTDAALLADAESALDLLALMFDAYEDGPACYEDPEERAGYLGGAVKLDYADVTRIADLLNRRRPRVTAINSAAKKEGGAA